METMQIEVKKINSELSKLSVQAVSSENSGRQIQELKTEFSSVKNILLSRLVFHHYYFFLLFSRGCQLVFIQSTMVLRKLILKLFACAI